MLSAFYQDENIILEYGSGGSTFLALESNPNTKVYCVETDKKWLDRIVREAKDKNLSDRLVPFHMNVGPTGHWGYPTQRNKDMANLYHVSSKIVWRTLNDDNTTPDVILIDGRGGRGVSLQVFLTFKVNARSYGMIMETVPSITSSMILLNRLRW